MKKIIAFFVSIAIAMLLCACGTGSNDHQEEIGENEGNQLATQQTTTGSDHLFTQPSTDPSIDDSRPTEEMIQTDLAEAIAAKNEYADIKKTEVIKSLTGDGTYVVTLSVTAETKYADWSYEAEMSYTKYDQGWMLDQMEWNRSDYLLARSPDLDTILELANNEGALSNVAPISGGTLYCQEVLETESLLHTFSVEKELLHAVRRSTYTARWKYDAVSDNWLYDEDNKLKENISYSFPEYDFSGTWSDASGYTKIMISNFSWDGFDMLWSYLGNSSVRFQPGRPAMGSNELSHKWFSDGAGNYVCMQFYENKTTLVFSKVSNYGLQVNLFVDITCELPIANSDSVV